MGVQSETDMKQVHVYISGQVQGVGFRQFVRMLARDAGVTGWVRNSEDGGVEAVVQGEQSKVESLMEKIKIGPFLSEVRQFGFEWEKDKEKLSDFTIR